MLVATASEDEGMEGSGGWAGTSSRVAAVASWYGPTDFTVGEKEFQRKIGRAVIKLFRGTKEEKPQEYRRASPIFHVVPGAPPLLLVQGDRDEIVPFDQALRMKRAYESRSLAVEFIPVHNAGHDFEATGGQAISPSVEEIHRRTVEFFKRQLVP